MKETPLKKFVQQFIKCTNAFDVDAAMSLFATHSVIDDVSVGQKFKNKSGVRNYLKRFFVGYNTVTKLESMEIINDQQIRVQVDFTGDFGHETGALNFTFNNGGLIVKIDAHLD